MPYLFTPSISWWPGQAADYFSTVSFPWADRIGDPNALADGWSLGMGDAVTTTTP